MTVDLLGPDPIYLQIAAVLRARIKDGTYPPQRTIASEPGIAEEFGVSRKTARAAITVLREEGLVRTVKGKGSFVVGPETE
jgi:GntR family transcriptional regulator